MIILPIGISFSSTLQWLLQNSYPMMFLGMIIEGPIITSAATFATTMGYFSLPIIFILAILGDIVGDIVFFFLGYYGLTNFIKKYNHQFKISEKRLNKLKNLVEKHPWRIILIIKLSPLIPLPGIVAIGSTKLSPKKFIAVALSIVVPKALFFMILGYFFGKIYDPIYQILNNSSMALLTITVLGLLIYFGYKKISTRFVKKLENK